MTAYRRNADIRMVRFEHWDGTPATPTNARVTLSDPRGAVVVDQAVPVAVSPVVAGGPTHSFTWTPGQSVRLGAWTERWTATIDAEACSATGEFVLSDSQRACT